MDGADQVTQTILPDCRSGGVRLRFDPGVGRSLCTGCGDGASSGRPFQDTAGMSLLPNPGGAWPRMAGKRRWPGDVLVTAGYYLYATGAAHGEAGAQANLGDDGPGWIYGRVFPISTRKVRLTSMQTSPGALTRICVILDSLAYRNSTALRLAIFSGLQWW